MSGAADPVEGKVLEGLAVALYEAVHQQGRARGLAPPLGARPPETLHPLQRSCTHSASVKYIAATKHIILETTGTMVGYKKDITMRKKTMLN